MSLPVLRKLPWLQHSDWPDVSLGTKSKYLGMVLGPGATPEDSYPCRNEIPRPLEDLA